MLWGLSFRFSVPSWRGNSIVKKGVSEVRQTWGWIQLHHFCLCDLGQVSYPLEAEFPHLCNGDNDSPHVSGLLEGFDEVIPITVPGT